MKKGLLKRIEKLNKNRRQRKWWQRAVRTMAMIVVFCTTYALILPAVTMEQDPVCGLEAHVHSDSCYVEQTVSGSELQCAMDSGTLTIHSHDALCFDAQGELRCTLPEVTEHSHTDACYGQVLTCTAEHICGEDCVTTEQVLVCAAEDAEHIHAEDCYELREIPCALVHTHGESCYTLGDLPICGKEETVLHTHEESCCASDGTLTCTRSVVQEHIHTESCLAAEEISLVLACGLEEHAHVDSCYPLEEEEDPQSDYLCGAGVHAHVETCYDENGDLTCTIPEHSHDASCIVEDLDLTADVETRQQWEQMLSQLALTGNWPQDVLTVAQSQLDYRESSKNVILEGDELKGYTRYGDWYSIPYGDWCATFVSFCLNYAGVENFPLDSVSDRWIEALIQKERYATAETYTAKPGDLIFFDFDQKKDADEEIPVVADHVGIVVEQIPATETESARIKTIEGNVGDRVAYRTYELDDPAIIGYGILPEHGYICGQEVHAHTESCYDDSGSQICLLEEHSHSDACYAEVEEDEITLMRPLLCAVEDHEHTDECYGAATAVFPYEDAHISLTVTVTSQLGLPEGLGMEVLALNAGDQNYTAYEGYASENASGELFGLNGYQVRFFCEGKEIQLDDAEITAELTVKPVEYQKADEVSFFETVIADVTMLFSGNGEDPVAAEEELAETQSAETEPEISGQESAEEPDTVLITVLQQSEDAVVDLGSAVFTTTQTQNTQITLTLSRSRTFALANQSVVNPNFTVQYYAHFPQMQYATETPDDQLALDVIDTRGNGDGTGGSLPRNGQGYNNPGTNNGVLHLLLEETDRKTTQINSASTKDGKSDLIYKVQTRVTLTEVYNSSEYKYFASMDISSLDKLHTNSHYELAAMWFLNADGETWTVYTEEPDSWAMDGQTQTWYHTGTDSNGNPYADMTEKITEVVGVDSIHEVAFTNNPEDTEKFAISDGDTIRLVYDLKVGTQNISANFFDYDISDTQAYLLNSRTSVWTKHDNANNAVYQTTWDSSVYSRIYMMTSAYGINSLDAYIGAGGSFDDSASYLAFGNQNTGVTHRYDTLNGYYINGGNTNTFKTCSFGLVKGLITNEYGLTSFLDFDDSIIHQALFNDEVYYGESVAGKTTYARQQLNFTRTGDTYILTAVNGGSDTLGDGIYESQLNEFILPGYAWNTTIPQFANNFWPLDGTTSDSNGDHDFEFGQTDETVDRWYYGDNATYYFPDSDDGNAHNSYFGMEFAVEFSLDGEYCGPLEYLFYGDDDMWVFLTDLDNGTYSQICDIGGVHGSVGSFTDLWDYIPKGEKGNYRLNFYYTERGATGSSCYMEFTLPDVTSVTQNIPETGSVSVEKKVPNAEVSDGETFEFLFELTGSKDNFNYEIENADHTEASSGIIASGGTFSLKAGQKITIVGIPKGLNYTIKEQLTTEQLAYYSTTWTGESSSGSASVSGTIENGVTHSYTCVNEALGSLEVSKYVSGITTTDKFKIDVTLTDADGNPLSGTFGGYTFDDDGTVTVTLGSGEKAVFTGIPVGTGYTVQEQLPDGYHVRYLLNNETVIGEDGMAAESAAGTIGYRSSVSISVVNATGYMLPETGGSGTSLITFGGLLMIAAACVYFAIQIGRKYRRGGVCR